MVVLQVTTDGHQVVDVKLTSGHPVLAPDAIKNVRTWKFADHTPTTLAVKYLLRQRGPFQARQGHEVFGKDRTATKNDR